MDIRVKNLLKYVLPTVISNCCFFLFTIVDGIFVGNGVGTDALGAVNIVFPFVMVVNAFFMLATIGGITVTAIRLGRGDKEGANQAFMHSLVLTVILSAIMAILGSVFSDEIASLLGANETYHAMVKDYLRCYSYFIIPSGIDTVIKGFCRNDGSPLLVSAAVIIGTCCNVFGDWLFVFPLQKGIGGAAIATGIAQCVSLCIMLSHFVLKKGDLRIKRFKPNFSLLKKIVGRGTPEMIAQFSVPVATLCTNYVLLARLGDAAVNAYSLICYVASFSVAIFIGTAGGLQPLFGQSYGAKNEKDLRFYFRAGVIINIISSVVITIVLFFVGEPVCAMFGAEPETMKNTVQFMPYYSWGFVIASLNTIISAYFYSTKRTKEAIILNICRSFVCDTAVILLLPVIFGGVAIWLTFGVYELVTLGIGFVLLKRSQRNGIVFK